MNSEMKLVDRFVAIWNEPSAERRRAMVSEQRKVPSALGAAAQLTRGSP